MKALLKLTTTIAIALALTACSNGPSDADIRNALEGGGLIKISDVEKVNGYKDGDRYIAEVRYLNTFQMSHAEALEQATGFDGMAIQMLSMAAGEWDKGDQFQAQKQFVFIDSENGWIIVD